MFLQAFRLHAESNGVVLFLFLIIRYTKDDPQGVGEGRISLRTLWKIVINFRTKLILLVVYNTYD